MGMTIPFRHRMPAVRDGLATGQPAMVELSTGPEHGVKG
jgi:hypothetical protein